MDVVIAVLLDLQQEAEFREALGGKSLQQLAVLLEVLQKQKQIKDRLSETWMQEEAVKEHGWREK